MTKPIYLHLGCGDKNYPGFINIDMDAAGADMHLDLTKPLPWEQSSVDGIYSEHFFEHITQAEGIRLLHECRRVLKPGGIVRIATPDLQAMVNDYVTGNIQPDWARFGLDWTATRAERFNIGMRWWGHQWLYDEEELVRLASMVGLAVIGRCEYGKSSVPMFNDREYRNSSRLIVEFRKPERQLAPGEKPLVSLVIPSYNPQYFEAALQSAVAQTYQNLEILVCDDCKTKDIEQVTKNYAEKDARIRYIRNPLAGTDLGRENHKLCFNEAKGEFLKFLNDDDLLAPTCVEEMVDAFKKYPNLTLVTSKRQRIDGQGNYLPDDPSTAAVVSNDSVIEGLRLGAALLSTTLNFVGEPTTVLFRKSDLTDLLPDFMSMDGKEIRWLSDIPTWLHLATKGNTFYITEPLSFFRIHRGQTQNEHMSTMQIEAKKAWDLMRGSWERRGLLKNA
jgi:predicted SAM-dependent methyltransferase/glycosyltransferase involved in cell wall biosynthesis